MKVLITGASGKIGTLARLAFSSENVTLMSRTHCECGANENWIECPSLDDVEWWANKGIGCEYDLVLHLAEPVKKMMQRHEFLNVVDSHVAFIKNASVKSCLVFYPQTALVYDRVLGKSEQLYLSIKKNVVAKTKGINNILIPVVHPMINYGDGLSNMRDFIQKIPFLNPLCDFKSTVPILYKNDLEKYLRSICDQADDRPTDYYSCELSVSDVFREKNKIDIVFFSFVLRKVLSFFVCVPKVYLLLNGRRLS